MAMTYKALLITREEYENGDGLGLITLRKYKDRLITFVSTGDYFFDNVTSYIVKDDVCYKTHKIFFDMDTNTSVMMCVEDINPENQYKVTVSGGGEDGSGFLPGPEFP